MKIFFLYLFSVSLLLASSGIEDLRKKAEQCYHQSDHYKSIVQNEVITEESSARQEVIIQERLTLTELTRREQNNKVFFDFVKAQTNEQKLSVLNIMKKSWQQTEQVFFEGWLIENMELQSSAVSMLKSQIDVYKNSDGPFDFYHYICLTMLFSKAHPLLDDWDIDLTILEIVLSQFKKSSNKVSVDEFMNSLKHYLNNDVNLMKQVVYWQRYNDHFLLELPIIDFFKHLEDNHFQYRQFLCTVIDAEFAKSLEGLR